jgi:tRNA A37 threonylcarbamoyladenosine synthetase subunit TsaC/SUA5/YrdC
MLPFRTPTEVEAAIPIVRPHLAANRLLGYPTETVYGLGGAPSAVARFALSARRMARVNRTDARRAPPAAPDTSS